MGTSFFKKKVRAWVNKVVAFSSDKKADVLERHKTSFGISKEDLKKANSCIDKAAKKNPENIAFNIKVMYHGHTA